MVGYVKYQASDQMRGRQTGSPEHRKAAEYVAEQFKADGLKPAGTDGYIQPVPFIVLKVNQEKSKAALIRDGDFAGKRSGPEVSVCRDDSARRPFRCRQSDQWGFDV